MLTCALLASSHEQVQLENKSPSSSQTQLPWPSVPYLLPPRLLLLPTPPPTHPRPLRAGGGVREGGELRTLAPPWHHPGTTHPSGELAAEGGPPLGIGHGRKCSVFCHLGQHLVLDHAALANSIQRHRVGARRADLLHNLVYSLRQVVLENGQGHLTQIAAY